MGGRRPNIRPGERVYVVAHGKLRGYAPLHQVHSIRREIPAADYKGTYRTLILWALVRKGEAVSVTIPEPISGFRGFRYRWWPREIEVAFPEWMRP